MGVLGNSLFQPEKTAPVHLITQEGGLGFFFFLVCCLLFVFSPNNNFPKKCFAVSKDLSKGREEDAVLLFVCSGAY